MDRLRVRNERAWQETEARLLADRNVPGLAGSASVHLRRSQGSQSERGPNVNHDLRVQLISMQEAAAGRQDNQVQHPSVIRLLGTENPQWEGAGGFGQARLAIATDDSNLKAAVQ
jgi:hypothetical protein